MLSTIFISACATGRTHFMQQLRFETIKDGTYIGQDTVVPMCNVKLSITVKAGRISEIKILRKFFTYPLAARAYTVIPQRIVKEQSLDVDAITTATVSSNSIKRAVLNALKKAEN